MSKHFVQLDDRWSQRSAEWARVWRSLCLKSLWRC